ncbi:uncharacterized protein I206_106538 [Kwoniella pini CBS 10737]|uniref:HMG box domain-containing protein n=1 Tax=Kwoniella pini CBS 10737 TaxID=1296096 RepID=A0A1B9HSA2_9TREE|nr:uncharacterized protein I206_07926 [Kwoniella pini CBS 10737]OCF46141.1 hypothetical protein I206_07926 [Kwoniella pini CBS 10737]
MASSDTLSNAGPSISRPSSVAQSEGRSVLSAVLAEQRPAQNADISVKHDNEKPKLGRTPSASPPHDLKMANIPVMPPMLRRVSQLSDSSYTSSHSERINPGSNLPMVQIIDQSGKEVIDPTLRDDEVHVALDSVQVGQNALPPMQRTDSFTSTTSGVTGLPPLPQSQPFTGFNNWSNLPPLNLYSTDAGTDTQPSSQTNSPTSPSSLWPSSYDLNGSLTDLNSSSFNTPDQGLSENEVGFGSDFNETQNESNRNESIGAGVPLPKKKSHARKQPEGHIKRARNAFILFRKHITDSNLIPPSVEVKHQNISVVAAKMWKEAPLEVRAKFNEQARIEKEEHSKKYPGYRYQPVSRRTDIIRRRVRKDPSEDEKVDAVAAALIEGKSGDKLEEEIKEQIIQKGNESDIGSEGSTSSARSRSRRRRDVGQLSKGAMRAQKAQARAKQMRQNLLGTNLLNMSLYNAATNRLATSSHHSHHQNAQAQIQQGYLPNGYSSHPGVAAHYSMYPTEGYISSTIGYDPDGRPVQMVQPGPADMAGGYHTEMYPQARGGLIPEGLPGQEHEMYRLPPIEGMMPMDIPQGGPYEWQAQAQQGGEYWDQPGPINGIPPEMGYGHPHASTNPEDYYDSSSYDIHPGRSTVPLPGSSSAGEGIETMNAEYTLPPLMDLTRKEDPLMSDRGPGDLIASHYAKDHSISTSGSEGTDGKNIEKEASKEGQQTPSNHVLFNERLFDGALGTAGLGASSSSEMDNHGEGEDLGMFDQAMEQAGGIGNW